MFRLSFSDGLGLTGIVSAIVLVVLDKAGKLKGPVLLILLAVAAVMTLPLAFDISWVADSPPGMARFSRTMLMVCFVGLIYSVGAVWISTGAGDHQAAGAKDQAQKPSSSGTITVKTSLRELFENDFPAMMKARRTYTFRDKWTHKEVVIIRQLYLDNDQKEKFVGFFVPSSGPKNRETKDVCAFLASHYEIALELEQEILGTVSPTHTQEAMSPADLAFKGRVYVYHENLLSVQERVQIEKQFRSHGVSVVLRGPAYLLLAAAATQAPAPALAVLAPPDRPRLVFDRWGQIPASHPVARPIAPTVSGQFLQNGFYLINDGGPAYEVTVEKFAVGTFDACSAAISRVGKEGGFAFVWVAQPQSLQSVRSPSMWDLPGAFIVADAHANPSGSMYRPDYSVGVAMVYRDGGDAESRLWYRSSATLTYIRSQGRLEFRDITHERGSPTRPS
jgi:hypothetical protein